MAKRKNSNKKSASARTPAASKAAPSTSPAETSTSPSSKPATSTEATSKPATSTDSSKPASSPSSKPAKAKSSTSANAKSSRSTKAKASSSSPTKRGHVATPTLGAGPSPFWFGFEVAWAKLALARVVIFGLLAADALLQIRHAPRYGAGGFNVAQLPGLDWIGPGRPSYAIAQLVSAYLFVFIACGVGTRFLVPLVTAIYAWLYFGSQLDSYQHHYLVSLVLLIACFVPWQRPDGAEPGTPVRAWAVRLILVQLAILYLWAAISKMTPAWLDGRTIANQITGSLASVINDSVGFKSAARFALLIELILAATIWIRPTWFIALPLGVLFHVGIIASGLEIGLFAYLMLGFYVLVVPDRAWVWIAETPPLRALRSAVRSLPLERAGVALALGIVGLIAGDALATTSRLPYAVIVAVGVSLLPLGFMIVALLRGRWALARAAGLVHLLAILLWLGVDRQSTVAVDYYRFWGGNARRLGDPATSERAYRKLIEIAPDEPTGHYQLGRLLLGRGEEPAGLASLRTAQSLEPARARAWIAEANYLQSKGRTPEAIEAARKATAAEPTHVEARNLLDRLTGNAPAPTAATDDTTE